MISYTGPEVDSMLARHKDDERSLRLAALLFGVFIGAAGVGAIWIVVTWLSR